MRLVKNSEKYWEFIRMLRNDEEVKKGFIIQDYITRESHRGYMTTYGEHYYICLRSGKPVGYIGEMSMDIRLAVLPEKQGKGVGKFMLREFMKNHPAAYGKVILGNEKSRRLFESAGFTEINRTSSFYYFIKK